MKILRVNMENKKITWEECQEKYKRAGGRLLTAKILSDEVPPYCNPLGTKNKLVIAPGLLVGSGLSSSARISFGAKSPLTGGIKESNAGGTTAKRLSDLGLKAVIIEGQPQKGELYYLIIEEEKAYLAPTKDLKGKGCYEVAKALRGEHGPKVALILIGPAGERQYSAACIANIDPEGRPSRVAGRGGLGAVMGSKGLKAIVVKNVVPKKKEVPEDLARLRKEYTKALVAAPSSQTYKKYGTLAMVNITAKMGVLPTMNFSRGRLAGAENLSGETALRVIEERGGSGRAHHACMAGCVIQCSNVYPGEDGEELVAPIEYETVGLMGSNCGFIDLDTVAKLNYLANDIGVDTIETGGALGVLMESGYIPFGDEEKALAVMEEIREDTILGRVLGQGTEVTAKVFNVKRVPVCKGQAFAAFDPRGVKGLGVTYATSPQGADHTAGHTIRATIEHFNKEGQVALSRTAQFKSALFDSLGLCLFVMPALGLGAEIQKAVEIITGEKVEEETLLSWGREVIILERAFNEKAGIGRAMDRLPEVFTQEELPETGTVFDVDPEDMSNIMD